MNFQTILNLPLSLARLSGVVLAGSCLVASGSSDFEAAEARTALAVSSSRIAELEAQLTSSKQALKAMAEKTANAVSEARIASEALSQLNVTQGVLGAGGGVQSSASADQKLIAAVSDLRLSEAARRTQSEQLSKLAGAASGVVKTSGPERDVQIQSLSDVLQEISSSASTAKPADGSGSDKLVVSVQPDKNLVVINSGQAGGMKTGSPLRIFRQEREIARAVVVDVRKKISGALVSSNSNNGDFPRPGDSIRFDATK